MSLDSTRSHGAEPSQLTMADNKTQRTNASVAAFLAAIPDPHRQRDAKALQLTNTNG
jgi:hypothetical protein